MTVHVAGAGMAGLAAAVTAARNGHRVVVHEAAAAPGGRCRSFFDPQLNRSVDNGTHVVLGANRSVRDFLVSVGGDRLLRSAVDRSLPFLDVETGEHWAVDCLRGAFRAVLGCGGLWGLAGLLGRSLGPGGRGSVAQVYGGLGPIYRRLILPLATAVLNRSVKDVPAADLAAVLKGLAMGGTGALAPHVAPRGLSPDWIDPAVAALKELGGEVIYRDPLSAIEVVDGNLRAAQFRASSRAFDPGDVLILALPPWALTRLSPHLPVPRYETGAIVCTHYLMALPARLVGGAGLMGVTGGTAEWLAARGDILSVTVSAADRLLDREASSIAALLWRDAAAVLDLDPGTLPPHRVVKERRATARIPGIVGPRTGIARLFIAGGWSDQRFPDTLEAAVRSGITAAGCIASSA